MRHEPHYPSKCRAEGIGLESSLVRHALVDVTKLVSDATKDRGARVDASISIILEGGFPLVLDSPAAGSNRLLARPFHVPTG